MPRWTHYLAIVAVAIAAGLYLTGSQNAPRSSADQAEYLVGAANAQTTSEEVDTSTIEEMAIGNPDAAVTVVEYASYTCPHCASFHEGNFKRLKAEYIDTGKINFVYREVYFDRYGLWASAIARCGDNTDRFFGVSDLLYQSQSTWARAGGAGEIVEELRKIGRLAGLDNTVLESCLQDGQKLRTLVAWFQEHTERDGVESTPSFVINGKTYRNMSYEDLKQIIDDASDS